MKNGALEKRLNKNRNKPSISISLRFPRSDVEALNRIEPEIDIRYDWIIRMLVRRFLRLYQRDKTFRPPYYICVLTEEEARKLGLFEDNELHERLKKGRGKTPLPPMK